MNSALFRLDPVAKRAGLSFASGGRVAAKESEGGEPPCLRAFGTPPTPSPKCFVLLCGGALRAQHCLV